MHNLDSGQVQINDVKYKSGVLSTQFIVCLCAVSEKWVDLWLD